MALPTYATLSGWATQHDSTTGRRLDVTAEPLTEGGRLRFDDRVTGGQVKVTTDPSGHFTMRIPVGGGTAYWRITEIPATGGAKVSGVYELPAAVAYDYADLVTVVPLPTAPSGGGAGAVDSVNGLTGVVVLGAADVGALPTTYVPPPDAWGDITGKPATFAPTIGVTATTALAGNTAIPDSPDDIGAAPAAHTHPDPAVTVDRLPAGSVLAVHYAAGWPARPTVRTDVTVHYYADASTDPAPADFVAGVDYLYRPA